MAPHPWSVEEAVYKLRSPLFAGLLGQEEYFSISRIGPL